jgi:uncharacterized membrane protein
MTIQNTFQFLTALLCGLIAGLLYSYSCSVNLGLRTLADNEYIKTMQAINIAIQNPIFFISFMGLFFIFPITSYIIYKQQLSSSFYFMLLAMIAYFVGVLGITMFCNVPLNEQLAKFPISTATSNEISAMRQSFEKPWNVYHTIRTIASIISFGLTILSLMKSKL